MSAEQADDGADRGARTAGGDPRRPTEGMTPDQIVAALRSGKLDDYLKTDNRDLLK